MSLNVKANIPKHHEHDGSDPRTVPASSILLAALSCYARLGYSIGMNFVQIFCYVFIIYVYFTT